MQYGDFGDGTTVKQASEFTFSNNEAMYACTSCGFMALLTLLWGFAQLQWDDEIDKESERNVWLILGAIVLLGALWSWCLILSNMYWFWIISSNEIFNPDGEAEKGFEMAFWFFLAAIWVIFAGIAICIVLTRLTGGEGEYGYGDADYRLYEISSQANSGGTAFAAPNAYGQDSYMRQDSARGDVDPYAVPLDARGDVDRYGPARA